MQGCYSREGWWTHLSTVSQFLSNNQFSDFLQVWFESFSSRTTRTQNTVYRIILLDISTHSSLHHLNLNQSGGVTNWLCRTVFTEPCCRGPPALTAQYYLSCCSAAVSLLQHLTWIIPDHCRWQFEIIFCKTTSINLEQTHSSVNIWPQYLCHHLIKSDDCVHDVSREISWPFLPTHCSHQLFQNSKSLSRTLGHWWLG